MSTKKNGYRPDIDGLRAIAVLLVLLFHFDLGVSGGFVGVDVFFWISGFLITDVIRTSLKSGKFSFLDFYGRRLLRLHPALLVTVAACLCIGFLIMDPASFSTLAQSAQYSIFSASNFYFWLNQGYFDASAQTQPLLHTWSLAAEWQFYVVWPLIVWAALKVSDKFLVGLLSAMTLVSLVGSQAMLSFDASAAYFMMPFRVFELSLGALLVFIMNYKLKASVQSGIAAMGLGLVVGSAFVLDSASPFPGIRALIPCLGAAAFIYAGQSSFGAVLRIKPLVWIGLISYSVYLVHWPVSVFYKYYIFREITLSEKLALLACSIAVGAAMYHLVEKVFMSKAKFVHALGYALTLSGIGIGFYGSGAVIEHQGIASRTPENYRNLVANPIEFHELNFGGSGFPLDGSLGATKETSDVVLGGDSFARQLTSGLDTIARQNGIKLDGLFMHGCYLSKSYTRLENGALLIGCKERYNSIISHLQGNHKALVFAQHWAGYKNSIGENNGTPVKFQSKEEYENFIIKNLEELRSDIGERPLIIIGSAPYQSSASSSASCLLRPRYLQQPCESSFIYRRDKVETYSIHQRLKLFAENNKNTYFIDPADTLCEGDVCKAIIDGNVIYSDPVHLSKLGSQYASKPIYKKISEILKQS